MALKASDNVPADAAPDDDAPDATPLITRRPIFDREEELWGYELQICGFGDPACDPDEYLKELLSAEFSKSMFTEKSCASINCLLRDCGAALISNGGVSDCRFERLAVTVNPNDHDDFHSELKRLKDNNMIVVVDATEGVCRSTLDGVDIVCMSFERNTPQQVIKFRKENKRLKSGLLAADVATWEGYQGARALGFNYFHGPFFTRPKLAKDHRMAPNSLAKLKLLGELNAPSTEIDRLARIISTDVALSYKLLQYINSASFGLSAKIKSIQQAISLLGLREIRRWAMMVLISDMDESPKGLELAYVSLQRGKFLESVCGETTKLTKEMKESMFLLGLFSNIDALLTCPMEQALAEAPLEEHIRDALLGKENEFSPWLRLLFAIERGDWNRARNVLSAKGVKLGKASGHYLRAGAWATEQLSGMQSQK